MSLGLTVRKPLIIKCLLFDTQKKQLLEVIVRNPTQDEVTVDATIEGRDLQGPSSITLPPGAKDVYTLQYAPAVIGQVHGRY